MTHTHTEALLRSQSSSKQALSRPHTLYKPTLARPHTRGTDLPSHYRCRVIVHTRYGK